MSQKIYEIITNEIIKKLESVDTNDFKKPWFNIGVSPFNAVSRQPYRGINYLTLGNAKHQSKAYASFNQWKEKGCQIRKGEKAHIAVFWKADKYEDEETGKSKSSLLVRYYHVFNSEQVEGEFAREIEKKKLAELQHHDPIRQAEELVQGYLHNENLNLKQSDRACYARSPGTETIEMPLLGQFKDPESYYCVFFHEMGHSTGAPHRLNRDLSGGFGSQAYAKEELVAELCSAMICGSMGLSQSPRIDHAQYIKNWLQCLKQDNRFVFNAASQAQKAADFITESAKGFDPKLLISEEEPDIALSHTFNESIGELNIPSVKTIQTELTQQLPQLTTQGTIDKSEELAAIKEKYGAKFYFNKAAFTEAATLWGAACNDHGVIPESSREEVVRVGSCKASISFAHTNKGFWLIGIDASTSISGIAYAPNVWNKTGYSSYWGARAKGVESLISFFEKEAVSPNSCYGSKGKDDARKAADTLKGERTPQLSLF